MKTRLFFAIIMLIAIYAFGQQNNNEPEMIPPRFKGNEKKLETTQNKHPDFLIKTYLSDNINYPKEAKNCNIIGTELVQFTVTTEGNVKNFRIINSVCQLMDNEVIRVLQQTNGMWIPGSTNGEITDMTKEIPICFVTDNLTSKPANEFFVNKAQANYCKGYKQFYINKNPKKALKYYNKAINYLPCDHNLLMARGMCKYELGDIESAQEDWQRLKNLGGLDMGEIILNKTNIIEFEDNLASLMK